MSRCSGFAAIRREEPSLVCLVWTLIPEDLSFSKGRDSDRHPAVIVCLHTSNHRKSGGGRGDYISAARPSIASEPEETLPSAKVQAPEHYGRTPLLPLT